MQGIPIILSGRDVVIHSNTGSGKTLTFVLPLLQLLSQLPLSTPTTGPVSLIVAPTRELADQIVKELSFFLSSPQSFFSPFLHRNNYADLDSVFPIITTNH